MAKAASHLHSQGAFSFFEEVEKAEPLPKPQKNELKPPSQILVEGNSEVKPNDESPEQKSSGNNESEDQDIVIKNEEQAVEVVVEKFDTEVQTDQLPINNSDSTTATEGVKEILNVSEIIETSPSNTPIEETDEDAVVSRKSSRGRKSIKEHTAAAVLVEMPPDEILYSKMYYSMRDVTTMFKENHSLIRYWESEFDILKPKKNGKGDRFFKPSDVKSLYLIYDLLRRRKFTIEGAKEFLKNDKKAEEKFSAIQSLEKIKNFFLELKAAL